MNEMRATPKEAVVVVGSGPIRIGQGIEFDYSCVHAAWALKAAGRSPVVINNNPETVSTDFDISDTLVFEPPGADEVEAAYRATKARGVMLAFGGQTAINLAGELSRRGVQIVGSDRKSLDMAENREQFEAALSRLGVARPQGKAARSFREARAIARELGFPVLVRPSFVLGGRAMEIVYNEAQLAAYAESAPPILAQAPLLVDRYLPGLELEVDAVFDGEDVLVPHFRTYRARGRPLRRLDQRLSGANHRLGNGTADRRHHASRRARARHSRPNQHPIRLARGAAVHHRSQPACQPNRSGHPESHGNQPRRRG